MLFWQYLFIISCFLVFYNYAGYAIIVLLVNKLEKNKKGLAGIESATLAEELPGVSFIVAAYNEEDCILEKITNSLQQDYPREKIEFLFITDGSTDRTAGICGQNTSIRTLHQPERKGKSAALNRAVTEARYEILIFSDANTILNKEAVRHITRHYRDEKVGGVAGEKKVLPAAAGTDEVGEGEGLYWKYESFLKKSDAAFYSVAGAAGELFSFRSRLYEPLPHNIILDDFVSSLKVAQKGYRIQYEPEAYAMELPSFSLVDEQKRKVRIAAGGFQAIVLLAPLLAFWKSPRLSFLYISHRVLRWTLSPLCMILAFIANAVLFFQSAGLLYTLLFIGQLGFYGIAVAAWLVPSLKKQSKMIKLASYFVFMNTAVILGFFRFLRGNQSATWEKAQRASAAIH